MDQTIILVFLAIAFGIGGQYWGFRQGVRNGMSRMYDTLYKRSTREGDSVIVKLEYESRFEKREW